MGFDYKEYLYSKINKIVSDLKEEEKISPDFDFIVAEEQDFIDNKKESSKVYVVFKRLSSELTYGVITQSYNIYLMSEQDQLEDSKLVGDVFSEENNYTATYSSGLFIKHVYPKPVVLSNFNEVGYGYRSVLYISASLIILEGILLLKSSGNGEINKITIDNNIIDVIGFNMNYSMTPDTQQFTTGELATSEKSTAGLSISFAVSLQDTEFNNKVLNIMTGYTEGNTSFLVSFFIGSVSFSYNMKLISAQLDDAPNQAPGLKIGLMV